MNIATKYNIGEKVFIKAFNGKDDWNSPQEGTIIKIRIGDIDECGEPEITYDVCYTPYKDDKNNIWADTNLSESEIFKNKK